MLEWIKRRLGFSERFYRRLLENIIEILKLYIEMHKYAKKNERGLFSHIMCLMILLVYFFSAFPIFSINLYPYFSLLTILFLIFLCLLINTWSKESIQILLSIWIAILLFQAIDVFLNIGYSLYQQFSDNRFSNLSMLIIGPCILWLLSNLKKVTSDLKRIIFMGMFGAIFWDYTGVIIYNISIYIIPVIVSLLIWYKEDAETKSIFKKIRLTSKSDISELKRNYYHLLGKEFKVQGKIIDQDSKDKNILRISSNNKDKHGIKIRYNPANVPKYFTIYNTYEIDVGDDIETLGILSREDEKEFLDAYVIQKLK